MDNKMNYKLLNRNCCKNKLIDVKNTPKEGMFDRKET